MSSFFSSWICDFELFNLVREELQVLAEKLKSSALVRQLVLANQPVNVFLFTRTFKQFHDLHAGESPGRVFVQVIDLLGRAIIVEEFARIQEGQPGQFLQHPIDVDFQPSRPLGYSPLDFGANLRIS